MKGITYPLASDGSRVVRVSEAERGGNYACLGCGKPMIPKRGDKITHHFAHKVVGSCSPDSALHETAKAHLERLFLDAKKVGKPLDVQHACPGCGSALRTDMVAGDRMVSEVSVVPGTRSDLVVFVGGRPHVIVEVVVTHDIEDATRDAYGRSGVLVVRVHPSWMDGGVTCRVGDALNAPLCGKCLARKKRVDGFLEGVSGRGRPRAIRRDRFGRSIKPRLASAAAKQARRIIRCGFKQQPSRPTLFKYETRYWCVFADIDSTKMMPIWETNAEAAVYAFPRNRGMWERRCVPDCRICVADKARKVLEGAGVRVRRYFSASDKHWHMAGSGVSQHL